MKSISVTRFGGQGHIKSCMVHLLPGFFQAIHLHFFQNLSSVFPVLTVSNTGSCVGSQDKIGHPSRCQGRLMRVLVLSAH